MSNPIAAPKRLVEDQEETEAKLRDRLEHEPTTEEIKAERDRLIRGARKHGGRGGHAGAVAPPSKK